MWDVPEAVFVCETLFGQVAVHHQPDTFSDLEVFFSRHRHCGQLKGDASSPTSDG